MKKIGNKKYVGGGRIVSGNRAMNRDERNYKASKENKEKIIGMYEQEYVYYINGKYDYSVVEINNIEKQMKRYYGMSDDDIVSYRANVIARIWKVKNSII